MFWCEHFEDDFKYRPMFPKGEVGLMVQQLVPSLTVLEKKGDFHPPGGALRFEAEREPADCRPKADKKIMCQVIKRRRLGFSPPKRTVSKGGWVGGKKKG